MKKQYFINANIVDPYNSINENGGLIVGENGEIEAIGKKVNTNNLPTREKPIDLKGKYIFPGLVDMRVFVGEPGYEYKENFRTLSNAALSGGVTSVVTMPNTDPVIDNVSIVDFLKRRGRDKSKINIFPCASLTQNIEGTNMTEFGLLANKGIIGFTDGVKTIQNTSLMSRIMNSAKDLGCLIMQHAEDYHLAKKGMINSGIIATKLGLSGIPDIAERIIIERDLALLEKIKCRYHISQLSSASAVEVIKDRKNEVKFTCGVSINNLSLNENDIGDFKTFLKLSPPLRKEEDREALVQGLKDKTIDVIVSDHKPEDEESKRLTFAQAATGASGIETLLSLSLELYHNGSAKLETIIQALTSNPAKILNINKGNLTIGNDADFCIVDLDKPWIVKKENLISKSKNTSIEDKKLQG
ncbi:dihydroorotase, partial [Candidatus Pelagibacter sp.]|nr:dihydroorotase [Candidatus Pelagibacter sp.]